MVIHVINPGDSLYRIAQANNVSLPYLIQQNELRDPTRLTPGQTIVVPQPAEMYTVKRNDSLQSIAEQNGTTVMRLWQDNPQLGGMDHIFPGQQLVLSFQQPRLGTFAVNGYAYPNIDQHVLRKTLPYLTYLSVFSYGFNTAGHILPQNATLLTRLARQYNVKPILVLTTLGEDGHFSGEHAEALLKNKTAQKTLLADLEQTIRSQGYAGVDIDFEYIPPDNAERYADFVEDVRERLEPQGFIVMVSLAPKTSANQPGLLYEAHDYEELGEEANAVLLMTYEWGYALSAPMAVAPIDKVEQVVRFAVSKIPPHKIFMGIPNYGYDWTLPYVKGQSRARSLSNVQAVEQAIQVGAPIRFDETAQSAHYNYWRERTEHEVWFEDARSIRAKLALASEYRLHGISIWNIMRYFPQLWLVLNNLYEIEKA